MSGSGRGVPFFFLPIFLALALASCVTARHSGTVYRTGRIEYESSGFQQLPIGSLRLLDKTRQSLIFNRKKVRLDTWLGKGVRASAVYSRAGKLQFATVQAFGKEYLLHKESGSESGLSFVRAEQTVTDTILGFPCRKYRVQGSGTEAWATEWIRLPFHPFWNPYRENCPLLIRSPFVTSDLSLKAVSFRAERPRHQLFRRPRKALPLPWNRLTDQWKIWGLP